MRSLTGLFRATPYKYVEYTLVGKQKPVTSKVSEVFDDGIGLIDDDGTHRAYPWSAFLNIRPCETDE